MDNKIWKNVVILLFLGLYSCEGASENSNDLRETNTFVDSLFDTLTSSEYEKYEQLYYKREDTTYDISDILSPEKGNSHALYYAINNKDTSFVETYLDIMDTVKFDSFFLLAFKLKSRLIPFDFDLWGRDIDTIEEEERKIIRANTMKVFWIYFNSCHLFNFEKNHEIDRIVTDKYTFYDRIYTSNESEDLRGIMDSLCR